MRNHLKISLWSLVLAATAVGAILGMHTRASAPELGSAGSPVVAAAKPHAVPVSMASARCSVTAADARSPSTDAVTLKSFGFLVFDRDPNAPGELAGFGPLPSE